MGKLMVDDIEKIESGRKIIPPSSIDDLGLEKMELSGSEKKPTMKLDMSREFVKNSLLPSVHLLEQTECQSTKDKTLEKER